MAATARQRATITEQTTPEFRRDLNGLSPEDRARVGADLRRSYALLHDNKLGFLARVERPRAIHLKGGLNSSLYSMSVGRDIRLIMTVDDDPIFSQTLVTLFRAVRRHEFDRAYRSIASLLYRGQIAKNGRAE